MNRIGRLPGASTSYLTQDRTTRHCQRPQNDKRQTSETHRQLPLAADSCVKTNRRSNSGGGGLCICSSFFFLLKSTVRTESSRRKHTKHTINTIQRLAHRTTHMIPAISTRLKASLEERRRRKVGNENVLPRRSCPAILDSLLSAHYRLGRLRYLRMNWAVLQRRYCLVSLRLRCISTEQKRVRRWKNDE